MENVVSQFTAHRGPGRPRKHREANDELTKHESLLGVPDVATFLRIHKSLVYQLVRKQGLPATRIGKHLRFYRHELLKWIEAQRVTDPTL